MKEYVVFNDKKYYFISDYKDNEMFRESFNLLTEQVYEFNFKDWYEAGYWQERYIPYSLADGGKIVANVSVNVIDFIVLGEKKTYVQIGTVMTDTEYRGFGLSRFLMEKVLEEWESKVELIYLFANDSVLDFYPRFGFEMCQEYQYSAHISKKDCASKIRRLNMKNVQDQAFVYEMVQQTVPFSKISMRDNAELIMFYCTSFMAEQIYYIEDEDVVVIYELEQDTLFLYDVFSQKTVELEYIIQAIASDQTKKVVFGFTPINSSNYEKNVLKEEDTTLFIKGGKKSPFELEDLMFPVLSHA